MNPLASGDVWEKTQGAFDIIYIGVYCRSLPDINLIYNTIYKLLLQLGWSPERPTYGVSVVIFGTPAFCQHVVSFCRTLSIPYSQQTLPRDNEVAFEFLGDIFKQLTHFVEFCKVKDFSDDLYSDMATNHSLSQLRVLFQ